MRFVSLHCLWLLAMLPIFIAIGLKWGRRANTLKNTQISVHIQAQSNLSKVLTCLIWLNKSVLWGILALAMAGTSIPLYSFGIDASGVIYFNQDTSDSMRWIVGNPNEIKLAALFDKKYTNAVDNRANLEFRPGVDIFRQAPPKQGTEAPRIATSLGAIKLFIEHSHGLNVGLTAFDDKFFYIYPHTKNSAVVINMLGELKQYIDQHGGGTNFDGPSDSAPNDGALQGAVNLFNEVSPDVTHIFVMVTDGDAPISRTRADELQVEFKKLNIHLFVFGVGEDWAKGAETVQPLTNFVKSVGGKVASVEHVDDFNELVNDIDSLARSSVHKTQIEEHKDALLLLLSVAGVLFILSLLLAALRRSSL